MRASIKSIFYRLFLSYSAIGTLPLAAAALVILVWGNILVVRFVQTMGMNYTRLVAEEIDETVDLFTKIGMRIADDPAVLQALGEAGMDRKAELELYQSMFQEIRGYLSVVEVHLTSSDGVKKFSTTEFPRRYDLTNHQVRESFFTGDNSQGPRILLAPGSGSEGNQVAFSIWFMLEEGLLFIDVRTQALETPYQASTSSRLFLVNRRQFSSLNLVQPHDPASFSQNPELGIVFTQEISLQPSPDQLVHRYDLRAQDLSVILATDLSSYFDTLNQILLLALALVTALLGITLLISVKISRSISRPIDSIIFAMTSSPQGPLPLPEPDFQEPRDELEQLAFHYNRMVETINSLITKIREEEQLLRNAERRALQAQIQPHFLYNTLGSIKSMAKLGDFAAVSDIVTDLGKILRFSLSGTEQMVPLKEVTDLLRRYLSIQKIRFQQRMEFQVDVDPEAEEIVIPKLVLEPLVENAVIHGVEKSSAPVKITLAAELKKEILEIRVEDSGPGLQENSSRGFGIGLTNVESRLRLLYGEDLQFRLYREGGKTIAMVRIPQ